MLSGHVGRADGWWPAACGVAWRQESSLITCLVGQGPIPPPPARQESRLEEVTGDNPQSRASGTVMAMGQVRPATLVRFRPGDGHRGQAQPSDRQAGPQRGDTSKVEPGGHLVTVPGIL